MGKWLAMAAEQAGGPAAGIAAGLAAKEYLQRAYILEKEISACQAQLERLRAVAEAARTARPVNGGRSGASGKPGDRLASIVADIADYEGWLIVSLGRYIGIMRDIGERIGALDDGVHKLVLMKRYLCYEKWKKIASDLNYHVSHVMRVHGEALEIIKAGNYKHESK